MRGHGHAGPRGLGGWAGGEGPPAPSPQPLFSSVQDCSVTIQPRGWGTAARGEDCPGLFRGGLFRGVFCSGVFSSGLFRAHREFLKFSSFQWQFSWGWGPVARGEGCSGGPSVQFRSATAAHPVQQQQFSSSVARPGHTCAQVGRTAAVQYEAGFGGRAAFAPPSTRARSTRARGPPPQTLKSSNSEGRRGWPRPPSARRAKRGGAARAGPPRAAGRHRSSAEGVQQRNRGGRGTAVLAVHVNVLLHLLFDKGEGRLQLLPPPRPRRISRAGLANQDIEHSNRGPA